MKAFLFSLVLFGVVAFGASDGCPKLKECVKDLNGATKLTPKKACRLLDEGSNCVEAVKCDGFSKKINEMDIQLTDLEFKMGCDGACAKEVDKCVSPFASKMTEDASYTLATCKEITKPLTCLANVKKDKNCNAKVIALVTKLAQSVKQNEFSSLCDATGKPTDCYKGLSTCYANLDLGNNKNKNVDCGKIQTYLECRSRLTCIGVLKKLDENVKQALETAETNITCPTVGTCNERMVKCATTAYDEAKNATSKKAECGTLKTSLTCFDNVRKDPLCDLKAAAITVDENKIKKLYTECGASSLMVSSVLVLLGVITAMFKNQ